MTRILARWPGMASFLQTHATRCTGLSFRNGQTSEPAGFMKFHEQIMSDLDAEFLVIQHDDLRRQLHSLCLDAGVVFKQGKAVDIFKSEDKMTVALEDGEILRGDIVVGADGHNSFVRSLVMDEGTKPENTVSGVNISIPTEVIHKHEEFRSLCNENQFTIWMGSGSSITGTRDVCLVPTNLPGERLQLQNKTKTFSLSICSSTRLDSGDGDMYESHDLSYLSPFDLSEYDPRLQKLIQLGRGCRPTIHEVFEQEDLVGLNGSIVLIGDAAHSRADPWNSQFVDGNAVTLGTLFSHLSDRKEISVFTETYEELRQRRTNETRISEYQSLVQISLPRGESLQEERDAALQLTLDPAFDDFENCESSELLVHVWEQYLVVFSHDAGEAVDNWWSKWGFTLRQ
ncbi:FAD-binding-3 domain-containing protein [Mycena venus]|uniref:FAD-binding-3 domain-containing protein n=1 Tax=Mycena venus TaxID=2733690 RepID=A0A8H6Y4F5_9AGAR|nr:FAD-binding-3 domain-containing protein [Mycena venus]